MGNRLKKTLANVFVQCDNVKTTLTCKILKLFADKFLCFSFIFSTKKNNNPNKILSS